MLGRRVSSCLESTSFRLRSFVPAHAEALQLLVNSNTRDAHWRNCWMDDDDLDELFEDVVDSLQAGLREVAIPRLRSRLEACRKVMRECRSEGLKALRAV